MKALAVLLVLVAACEKKEAGPSAGSGSGSAAGSGSGSAVGQAGSGSAAVAPTSGDPRIAEAMKAMNGFVDEVCACKDVACITGVQGKLQAWAMEEAKKPDQPQPGPEEMKQLEVLGKRMEECAGKVAMAAGGSGAVPPPAAPVDEAKNAAIFAPRIAKMKDFTAKICACKDAACKTKVNDEMMKWGKDTFKDTEGAQITPDIQKEMTAIAEEYGKCAQ